MAIHCRAAKNSLRGTGTDMLLLYTIQCFYCQVACSQIIKGFPYKTRRPMLCTHSNCVLYSFNPLDFQCTALVGHILFCLMVLWVSCMSSCIQVFWSSCHVFLLSSELTVLFRVLLSSSLFLYIFWDGQECVATPLLMQPILYFWEMSCIRTQRSSVASRCATNLATHLPKLSHPSPYLTTHLPTLSLGY